MQIDGRRESAAVMWSLSTGGHGRRTRAGRTAVAKVADRATIELWSPSARHGQGEIGPMFAGSWKVGTGRVRDFVAVVCRGGGRRGGHPQIGLLAASP